MLMFVYSTYPTSFFFFFFNATATTEIYTLSLHDALPIFLSDLGKRDVQSVLLEGGPTLAWSMVEDRVVDKVVVYLAPKLIGGQDAPGVLGGRGFAPIAQATQLRVASFDRVGEDLRVEAHVHRDH